MNKELCFIIKKEKIYLEKILVEYIGVPIFFLCKSDKFYYLSQCVDIDNLEYIVVKLSDKSVFELLNAKITMRDVILKQNGYWYVISSDEVEDDEVNYHKVEEIDVELLPEEGSFFEAFDEEIKNYILEFKIRYLENNIVSSSFKYRVGEEIMFNDDVDLLDIAEKELLSLECMFNCEIKYSDCDKFNFSKYLPQISSFKIMKKEMNENKLEYKNIDSFNLAA